MPNTAMFHRLGNLGKSDVYLEKYSRSLVCLGGQASHYLARDCDRDVTVSDGVRGFLSRSRLSDIPTSIVGRKDSRKEPGIELTLLATDCCNFACSYCFANELYPGSITLKSSNITSHIKDFLNLTRARVSSLILFGGEPLLAFKAIKTAWTEVQYLFNYHQGSMPSLAIVTNGSLITREIAKFLADNDFAVTVSLDGPKVVHDLCRPLKRGQASYEQVIEGINALSKEGVFYAIEATYTSTHLEAGIEVIDVVDHSLALNAQEVHVMPAFPEQASGIEVGENTYVASLFKAAAARAAYRYLTSGVVELAYASRLCYAFANDLSRRFICTAGIDKFTIMANGDIVPCYLVCDSVHKITSCSESRTPHGNTTSLEEAATAYRVLVREHLPECSQCWASDWCFACYGPGYARQGCLGAPGGLECDIYRAMIEATLLECARFLADLSPRTFPQSGKIFRNRAQRPT